MVYRGHMQQSQYTNPVPGRPITNPLPCATWIKSEIGANDNKCNTTTECGAVITKKTTRGNGREYVLGCIRQELNMECRPDIGTVPPPSPGSGSHRTGARVQFTRSSPGQTHTGQPVSQSVSQPANSSLHSRQCAIQTTCDPSQP